MPLAFQWFVNTTNLISDATNAILQLTNVQWSQAGAYTLVASNCYGSATSSPAILTVTVSPVIVSSPTNRMTRTGDTVDFSVETVGALPLACQWFFGTNAILQATNSILYLTNVQPRQSGAYSVVITNIYGAVTSALALLEFTVTVTNCTEANLRAAMAGCGMVSFASDGTITLTSTITNSVNTILDATGHQITISGGNRARVFVVGTNATLTLNHLTIANGGGDGDGGNGGALLNMGTVNATDCTFRNNTPYTQAACYGGAIYNDVGGTMSLDSCRFTNNSAIGSSSGAFLAGDGAGGAIFNNGALVVRQSDFAGNKANGGGNLSMWGSSGGNGFGGAICNAGTLLLDSCTIENNTAQGGNGTGGVTGGNGGAGGAGGSGGSGLGGALCNYGTATAVNTTFVGNGGYGGYGMYGGIGGYGMYGGIGGNSAILGGNGGNGGPGGNGGDGFGAIYSIGQLLLTNCTLASNSGVAGSGGPGGPGGAGRGTGHSGSTGASGSGGHGAGGIGGSGILINTLLAANSGNNCYGTLADVGHNLSSDATCAFTNVGSMNNTDPQLGPFADNGGPTLTMALLPGSPAIDAGTVLGAPATDQRGVPRPQGAGVDIGAFECLASPVFTCMTIQSTTNCQMQLSGLTPNPTLTLQISTNLLNWQDATNFTAGPNGVFQCVDPIPGGAQLRFYRLKSGTP